MDNYHWVQFDTHIIGATGPYVQWAVKETCMIIAALSRKSR